MKRFAVAFARGALFGVRMMWMFVPLNAASKAGLILRRC
jgi:hypothetical protein